MVRLTCNGKSYAVVCGSLKCLQLPKLMVPFPSNILIIGVPFDMPMHPAYMAIYFVWHHLLGDEPCKPLAISL